MQIIVLYSKRKELKTITNRRKENMSGSHLFHFWSWCRTKIVITIITNCFLNIESTSEIYTFIEVCNFSGSCEISKISLSCQINADTKNNIYTDTLDSSCNEFGLCAVSIRDQCGVPVFSSFWGPIGEHHFMSAVSAGTAGCLLAKSQNWKRSGNTQMDPRPGSKSEYRP